MKRYGDLWGSIIAPENIDLAYRRARQGKTWQRTVQAVDAEKVSVLKNVREMLVERTFTTSAYREKTVYEPKQRQIYILPFNPDRIVQHALMSVVAPIWDKMFDPASHACRPGKGQHGASRAVMGFVRRNSYVMQADVRKFYPSVNHDVAMRLIARKIKDKAVLWLFDDIVRSFPGDGKNLPIGNLTSQWIGNLYLNELDRFVRSLGVRDYARYNDDFLVFGNDKKELHQVMDVCRAFLRDELDLTMAKERVYPVSTGVDFVGYRHFPKLVMVRKRTATRIKKKIKGLRYLLATGRIEREKALSVVAAVMGWLKWANAHNLQRSLGMTDLLEGLREAV